MKGDRSERMQSTIHAKILTKPWLSQVAKTPADAVPADVAQAVSEFMAAKDAAAVAAFAGALIDAAFDAMPESANRLQQAPPKANVSLSLQTPP
jgi:hypothetical protein